LSPDEERALWERYRDGDSAGGETIASLYIPLARLVAGEIVRRVPVDREVLLSGALLGLAEAIARFHPDRGLKFSTFARWLIRGRVLDEIRSLDQIARSTRRRQRETDHAAEQLAHDLGHFPTSEELSAAGIEQPQIPETLSIESLPPGICRALGARHETANPFLAFDGISGLTRHEQYLLNARFILGRPNHEIARRLGVSTTTVSVRWQQLLRKLRRRIEEDREALLN